MDCFGRGEADDYGFPSIERGWGADMGRKLFSFTQLSSGVVGITLFCLLGTISLYIQAFTTHAYIPS